MAGFENKLATLSQAVLKRELSEGEKVEFLELASTLGMSNVEDYLYMIMIFKRTEDKMNGTLTALRDRMEERIDELDTQEKKITDTLEASVNRVLGEGAQAIGRNMGDQIGREARDTLTSHKEHYFLQGQVAVAGMIAVVTAIAYYLGATIRFGKTETGLGLLDYVLRLPAGFVVFFCALLYVAMWSWDFWWQIQDKKLYKIRFGLQILALVILLFYLLPLIL